MSSDTDIKKYKDLDNNSELYGIEASHFDDMEEDQEQFDLSQIPNAPAGIDSLTSLAVIYGAKGPNGECVLLPYPLILWMPGISTPASECGFEHPYRVWDLEDISLYDTNDIWNLGDGIKISFRNVALQGGWVTGQLVVEIRALGKLLLRATKKFKTKTSLELWKTKIFGISIKVQVYVKSFKPLKTCCRVDLKGPFGYKDSKTVCV